MLHNIIYFAQWKTFDVLKLALVKIIVSNFNLYIQVLI